MPKAHQQSHSRTHRHEQESRRREAVKRVLAGESPRQVAQRFGVHRSRVYHWLRAYRLRGGKGLRAKSVTGRPAKLSEYQRGELLAIIHEKPPSQIGLQGNRWTANQLKHLIEREFSVSVSQSTANRLLAGHGWQSADRTGEADNGTELTVSAEFCLTEWILLLERSLLDTQHPFGLFLSAVSDRMQGIAIIYPNLCVPSSPIRSQYKHMNLEKIIALNKAMTDTWHANPFIQALQRPGDIRTLDELIAPADWEKNAYCRSLLRNMGGRQIQMLGLCFAGPDDTLCGMIINKMPGGTPFTEQERRFLQQLRPHLEIAIELAVCHWRSTFTVKALEEATDHLEIAALVLDGEGKVIKTNGTAEEMLTQKKYLTLNGHKLDFLSANHQALFERAVKRSIAWRQAPLGNKPVEAMRFTYPSGDWLGLLVQPITPPSVALPYSAVVSPHTIVYLSDPAKARPSPQHQIIVRLFQLSTREAYLTTLLVNDHTLEEAARQMNITPATARTYLQHIYEKVGVNRRQDLVQRVMKSVALLG